MAAIVFAPNDEPARPGRFARIIAAPGMLKDRVETAVVSPIVTFSKPDR